MSAAISLVVFPTAITMRLMVPADGIDVRERQGDSLSPIVKPDNDELAGLGLF